jgi:hypothetical protein
MINKKQPDSNESGCTIYLKNKFQFMLLLIF